MRKRLTGSCALLSLAALLGCAGAQRAPESSSRLSKLHVELPFASALIHCNPALSVVLMQELDRADHPDGALRALQTRIDASATDIHVIDFDQGPSIDPRFIVHRKEDRRLVRIAELPGTELTVPGDGSILVSGIADDEFDRLRKYVLAGRTIREVVQPFYHVGITTTNTRPLDLYADLNQNDIVEHLPSGSVVEVVLARATYPEESAEEGPVPGSRLEPVGLPWPQGYDYLVKSPRGLMGWVRGGGLCGEELLRGICFHGD